ncbi:TPA: hypothetical protein DDW35_00515, partial [Candidatus Sumerlaeota bacterium]|nr:hypothetical protein [Candidatus Sumerlaeota bacterium]
MLEILEGNEKFPDETSHRTTVPFPGKNSFHSKKKDFPQGFLVKMSTPMKNPKSGSLLTDTNIVVVFQPR